MDFKLLNLRNTRKFIAAKSSSLPENPDRRSFIKSMGIGVIAVNPIAETIKSINFNPFEIRLRNNKLFVSRNGKVVWEISDRFFAPGYELQLKSTDHSYLLHANNLQIKDTNLQFSISSTIFMVKNDWKMKITIPELSLEQEVNFVEWLDKNQTINSIHNLDIQLIKLNEKDRIELKGNCKIQISSDWRIELHSPDHVIVYLHDYQSNNDDLVLKPFDRNSISFTKSFDDNSVAISVPRYKGWGNLMSQFVFYETNRLSFNEDTPDLNFLLHQSKEGNICLSIIPY